VSVPVSGVVVKKCKNSCNVSTFYTFLVKIICHLYFSPNIISGDESRMRWARHVACGYHQVEHSDEIGSKEIEWEGTDWIHLVRGRDVAACSKHGFYKTREMCGLTKDMIRAQDVLVLLVSP